MDPTNLGFVNNKRKEVVLHLRKQVINMSLFVYVTGICTEFTSQTLPNCENLGN